MTEEAQDPRKVITPLCRLSYAWLLEPKEPDGDDKKAMYCASFIFDPDADMKPFQRAIIAAAKEEWPDNYKELMKKKFKMPLLEQADYDKAGYGDSGYFIRTKSPRKPGVVHADGARTPVFDPEEVFAGLLVHGSVRAFAWTNDKGGKGVSFSLENVMLVKDDGTRFDTKTSPDEDFAGLSYSESAEAEGADGLPDDTDDIFG